MEDIYLKYFQLLKRDLEKKYRISYPNCNSPIEEWKGQHIVNFQEDLIKHVGGSISEKWFYTHIKAENKKVPRIDMLDLLSKYAGYQNWEDFIGSQSTEEDKKEIKIREEGKKSSKKVYFTVLILTLIAVTIISLIFIFMPDEEVEKPTYTFCFVDADNGEQITDSTTRIIVLHKNETPVHKKCNKNGCFVLQTEAEKVSFVVKAPYFKLDTIHRKLSGTSFNEEIQLQTDDYALMIHIFSTSKIEDWKRRRAQLNDMIADNAKIVQVSSSLEHKTMELYNKQGFINKLTIPAKSLKNIKVIETRYTNGKISMMRFTQLEL